MKKYLSVALLTSIHCFAADFAADKNLEAPNKIFDIQKQKEVAITEETLLSLMPKLPQQYQKGLEKQLSTLNVNLNGSHWKYPQLDDKIQQNNIIHEVEMSNKTFFIKSAGSTNRIITAMHEFDPDAGKIWSVKDYYKENLVKLQKRSPITTFQTASRGAYFLIAQEVIKKHCLNNINVPTTYLYTTDNGSIDDNHAVIFQKKVNGFSLEDKLKMGYKVSSNQLGQLFSFTELIGAWHLKNDLIVDEDGKISLVDLEGPNNTPPSQFFHKNFNRYHGNIVCGIIHGLFKIFENDKEHTQTLVEMVLKSDIINHEKFSIRYKNELLDFVGQFE